MLQSMTGFGNYSVDSEMGKISVDIKTLNSKNLDLNYNLSPFLKDLEESCRPSNKNLLELLRSN